MNVLVMIAMIAVGISVGWNVPLPLAVVSEFGSKVPRGVTVFICYAIAVGVYVYFDQLRWERTKE